MKIIFITALGVGGATVLGSIIGFLFRGISHRFSDIVLSFAAGVMLAASILGLILPALEYGSLITTIAGIFTGALCLNLIDKVIPHLHRIVGLKYTCGGNDIRINRILLFVTAIAIHNLPEGIAAGVSFGTDDLSQALFIAGGIALQNIPEGMVIISPMLSTGITPGRTFLCALATGMIEVIGTFLGYFAVTAASMILPFGLAFGGGTMLYVISDEMIPETHSDGSELGATYALLAGFCLMLISDVLLA